MGSASGSSAKTLPEKSAAASSALPGPSWPGVTTGIIYLVFLLCLVVSLQASIETEAAQVPAQARFFRVLGDPTRLRILQLLLGGPRSVSELVAEVGAAQARVSNHLACLRWCQFVESERHGRQVVYRISDPSLGELFAVSRRVVADKVEHLASCQRIGPDWI